MDDTRSQTPWTAVFARSSLGANVFYAKGGRAFFQRVIEPFEGREIPARSRSEMFSPTGLGAAFLDGGVVESERMYFQELTGARVIGTEALRFVCFRFGLRQPKKLRGEPEVPTVEDILMRLRVQLDRQRGVLERRAARFANVLSQGSELATLARTLTENPGGDAGYVSRRIGGRAEGAEDSSPPRDLSKASAKDIAALLGREAPMTPLPGVESGPHPELATFLPKLRTLAMASGVKLSALLNGSCEAVSWRDGVLTLGFYEDKFHKKGVEEAQNRKVYEELAAQILLAPVSIRCVIMPHRNQR